MLVEVVDYLTPFTPQRLVRLRSTSPSQTYPATQISDNVGQFRVAAVPPGTYILETATGMAGPWTVENAAYAVGLTNATVAGALGISSDGAGNLGAVSEAVILSILAVPGGGVRILSALNADPVSGAGGTRPGNINPSVGDAIITNNTAAGHWIWACQVGGATPTWINKL